MEDQNQGLDELTSRRKWIKQLGRVLLGASLVGLSSCLPRETNRFEVKILLTQNRSHFDPGGLVVSPGSTVVWQNRSIYPQTVTCDPRKAKGNPNVNLPKGAAPWDSGVLYPGQTWEYTFKTAGEYLYFSQLAEGDGPYLTGTVKVT